MTSTTICAARTGIDLIRILDTCFLDFGVPAVVRIVVIYLAMLGVIGLATLKIRKVLMVISLRIRSFAILKMGTSGL